MKIELEGLPLALKTLDRLDGEKKTGLARALHRIGGIWKRYSVDYAPISPTTSMLKQFAKRLSGGGANARTMYVAGRKGKSGSAVKLTAFYEFRLNMLIGKKAKKRPMPGGIMRSITMRSTDSLVEVFVPANSVAGSYAFKIHEERGRTWKDLGPGTQAKGGQAREKFITRAATDKKGDFVAIVEDEVRRAIEKAKS